MRPHENLDNILKRFGENSAPNAVVVKDWPFREDVGFHPRFKGSQELRVVVVGDVGREHVLLETRDTKDGVLFLKRQITFGGGQLVGVMDGLLRAEVAEADRCSAPLEHRPELPMTVVEVPGSLGTISIRLDEYNGRVQVKLSRAVTSRSMSGEWASFNVEDIHPIGVLLLKSYHLISNTGGLPSAVAETEIPF